MTYDEQWIDIKKSPKKVPKQHLHPKKTILIICWAVQGVVHYNSLPPGTITFTSWNGYSASDICQIEAIISEQKGAPNIRLHVAKLNQTT